MNQQVQNSLASVVLKLIDEGNVEAAVALRRFSLNGAADGPRLASPPAEKVSGAKPARGKKKRRAYIRHRCRAATVLGYRCALWATRRGLCARHMDDKTISAVAISDAERVKDALIKAGDKGLTSTQMRKEVLKGSHWGGRLKNALALIGSNVRKQRILHAVGRPGLIWHYHETEPSEAIGETATTA